MSKRPPNKREQARIERMVHMGCVACAAIGMPNYHQLELHHILSAGKRMGHWYSLFLCKGHHQNQFTDAQKARLTYFERASIAGGRKLFSAVFGTERKLWEKVQFVLDLSDEWPTSKILPRRAA